MKNFLKKAIAVVSFPIFFALCCLIFVFATLLLLPFSILSLIDWILFRLLSTPREEGICDFGEFIFACYGFCLLLMIIPVSAFDNNNLSK